MRLSATSAAFLALLVGSMTASAQMGPPRNSCPVMDQNSHLIAPGDTLGICERGDCWLNPIVSADGKIVMPLLGEIQVLGLTSDQVAQLIRERLSMYRRNPAVSIYVENGERYYVSGEVSHPGSYCLETPTTILEALDIAGGFRKLANPSKIRIVRGSLVLRFNYKEFRKEKHPEQNVLIEKGDHIIVL